MRERDFVVRGVPLLASFCAGLLLLLLLSVGAAIAVGTTAAKTCHYIWAWSGAKGARCIPAENYKQAEHRKQRNFDLKSRY